jgi:HlyD family secretion protein
VSRKKQKQVEKQKQLAASEADLVVVNQFQSETDAIREAPEPRWARSTTWLLGGFVTTIVVLMFVLRMDRVVTSVAVSTTGYSGIVQSTHALNVYQALDPSIVKTIDVKQGQLVSEGQVLATLDPTIANADVLQLKLQIASLKAQIARDEAELNVAPLVFPENPDPDFQKYAAIQKALYDQQMAYYNAQISSFDANIKLAKATIVKYQADKDGYQLRLNIAKDLEKIRTTLANKGYDSLLNQLVAQDASTEMARLREYDQNSYQEALQQLDAATANREAFIQQWYSTASQDLATARSNLDTAQQQLDKAGLHQDVVVWKANEPSVVLTVANLSVGSVLTPGAQLMTLMPVNTPVQAELKISTQDVGFIRKSDPCTLKIDAFQFMEHGTAEGTVQWISEGAFSTDDSGQPSLPYYKAQCSVDTMHFEGVPANFRLMPGMTLTGDVWSGTRSVAMYYLSGMIRGWVEAMREAR